MSAYNSISEKLSEILTRHSEINKDECYISYDSDAIIKDLSASFSDYKFSLFKEQRYPRDSFIIKATDEHHKSVCIKIYDECYPLAANLLDEPHHTKLTALSENGMIPKTQETTVAPLRIEEGSSAGSRVIIYNYRQGRNLASYLAEDPARFEECKKLLSNFIRDLIKKHKTLLVLVDASDFIIVEDNKGQHQLVLTDTNRLESVEHASPFAVDGRVRVSEKVAESFLRNFLEAVKEKPVWVTKIAGNDPSGAKRPPPCP